MRQRSVSGVQLSFWGILGLRRSGLPRVLSARALATPSSWLWLNLDRRICCAFVSAAHCAYSLGVRRLCEVVSALLPQLPSASHLCANLV
eukprot:1819608-Alexandrium_andersonii.AAC.1